jgi:hypothetical protein
MRRFALASLLSLSALLPVQGQKGTSPLVGRWNCALNTPAGQRAAWLGIRQNSGVLAVWYQPPTGNVYQVKDFKVTGDHLTATVGAATAEAPATVWELDAAGDRLTGTQTKGAVSTPLQGARAPELKRPPPAAWSAPEPLFNGKSLEGWEPIGDPAKSRWKVQDGLLVNLEKGLNLKSTRKFDDFKLHFEVNCPDGGNSGFYLRGRYEVQLEYEPLTVNPAERRIGSIYGRIAPKGNVPRRPGTWETFDVTLVGRTLTVVRNGVTTVDRQEIEGITGGALDADEGQPGPFYIQGDHTGGLKFRNISVAVPKPR